MTKSLKALAAAAALAAAGAASATPSTTVWTPATTYTQPYLVPHLTYDTYVAEKGMLQNTYGVTVGVVPGDKVQGELGFDLFYPGITGNTLQLNGKLTLVENLLGKWSPALSVGIANAGFGDETPIATEPVYTTEPALNPQIESSVICPGIIFQITHGTVELTVSSMRDTRFVE